MQDEHILFSIVVPVYKVEKYLSRCIESILHQSYGNFELILVDDGSPDDSPRICDEYSKIDKRVHVIHAENSGVSAARNLGISFATGDWVLFSDSDDWLEKDTLKKAYEMIMKKQCDVIQFGFRFVYPNNIVELYPQKNKSENLSKLHFCTMIINRKFLLQNEICFPTGITFAEDWYFKYMLYSANPKISYQSYICYNYFMNSASVMHNISYKNIMDEIEVIKMAEGIDSVYKKNLIYQKKVAKDKLLFVLNDVRLWKLTFSELNIKHVFWSGPKHVIKSILCILGLWKRTERIEK